ncbi:APC membrane recruitment protein 1 [Varanus komodoensis]|uniref:APC membrane recruitment protein 1 n=1 Tax=Varanus komodoensis TaxID=61221 RepID=UPI001CF788FF|nr:APC membrane recruitment protein 1 [Varanus komodoensis]
MAATRAASVEENAGAKLLLVPDGNRRSLEENGAADQLSEQSDALCAMLEPNRPQAPAGKLKKTAFKLFGGKRSICALPNFFGGKSKGQEKGASKKGLSKSKTHDGISDVGYEEASSGRLRSPSDGGTDFPPPQLSTSQSAHLGTVAGLRVGFVRQSASLSGSSEGFEKRSSGEKSLFLPRPKKGGLRGLFSSIRRHRKSKTAEPERTELQEWALRDSGADEQARLNQQNGAETQPASKKGSLKSIALCSEHREGCLSAASSAVASGELTEGDQMASPRSSFCADAAGGTASCEGAEGMEFDTVDGACEDSAFCDIPDAVEPVFLSSSPSCIPPGDPLSLMFGDVTSLQSFDSFTGCGDIIAEPDMDSITESSTSAERGRDATKRSSCLVTYQGGGEEMAMPDEMEEYLQQMWDGAIKADASFETHLPELLVNSELQGVSDTRPEGHLYSEGTRNDVELLTPHSDQQESAPNSDEGYYDSTTPGPEDEAGDGLDEIQRERLPRDSYSGDALYEFYEPDDALMSPSHGEQSCFDREVTSSDIFSQFLDFTGPDEKDLVRKLGQKNEVMETEEERMAAIQKQLLYWELQREPAVKHLDRRNKDQHQREKEHTECKMRAANTVGKSPSCLGCEQIAPLALNSALNSGIPAGNQDWKDLQEMLCPGKHYSGSCGPKPCEGCLIRLVGTSSVVDSGLEHTVLEPCALSDLALEKSVAYPFYQMRSCHSCPPGEPLERTEADFVEAHQESKQEPEQVVNFSQALVEFTSSGTLFSNLSESLGSSDSGSAFTQNLPALPTMVTFDIVDVEQEGEGECEQHLEMNTDEDIAASFEAFDDSSVPKESFAECDERMFPGFSQSNFHSCSWGVASLPRRLRLQEVKLPLPEPLSTCRRSRSLDTESLEFELASLQLSKNGFKPCEFWSPWSGCRKDLDPPGLNVGQESSPCSPEERAGSVAVLSWPGLSNVPYDEEFSQDMKPRGRDPMDAPAFHSPWGVLAQPDGEPPFTTLVQKEPSGQPRPDGGSSPMPPAARPVARPSNLPLQGPLASQELCASHRPGGDSAAKKLAWILPLGEDGAGLAPNFGFGCSPDKSAICKPVDAMQGMSQLHNKQC